VRSKCVKHSGGRVEHIRYITTPRNMARRRDI